MMEKKMTLNPVAYAAALRRTPPALKQPLSQTSPIIEMWRTVVKDQFAFHCSPSNRISLRFFTCVYVRPEVSYTLGDDGILRVVLSEEIPDENKHSFYNLVSDRSSINVMGRLVILLKDLSPSAICVITSITPGGWSFTLGPRQLLQFLFVVWSLFKENKIYYRRFFEEVYRVSCQNDHYDRRGAIEVLRRRNHPHLVEEREILMEELSSKLEEWKVAYIAMKRSMGESEGLKVSSLASLSLSYMVQPSYQLWHNRSHLHEIQVSPLYLERTFLVHPDLKDEFVRIAGLGLTIPIALPLTEPQLCCQGGGVKEDNEDLNLIPFVSLLSNYEKRLDEFILRTVLIQAAVQEESPTGLPMLWSSCCII